MEQVVTKLKFKEWLRDVVHNIHSNEIDTYLKKEFTPRTKPQDPSTIEDKPTKEFVTKYAYELEQFYYNLNPCTDAFCNEFKKTLAKETDLYSVINNNQNEKPTTIRPSKFDELVFRVLLGELEDSGYEATVDDEDFITTEDSLAKWFANSPTDIFRITQQQQHSFNGISEFLMAAGAESPLYRKITTNNRAQITPEELQKEENSRYALLAAIKSIHNDLKEKFNITHWQPHVSNILEHIPKMHLKHFISYIVKQGDISETLVNDALKAVSLTDKIRTILEDKKPISTTNMTEECIPENHIVFALLELFIQNHNDNVTPDMTSMEEAIVSTLPKLKEDNELNWDLLQYWMHFYTYAGITIKNSFILAEQCRDDIKLLLSNQSLPDILFPKVDPTASNGLRHSLNLGDDYPQFCLLMREYRQSLLLKATESILVNNGQEFKDKKWHEALFAYPDMFKNVPFKPTIEHASKKEPNRGIVPEAVKEISQKRIVSLEKINHFLNRNSLKVSDIEGFNDAIRQYSQNAIHGKNGPYFKTIATDDFTSDANDQLAIPINPVYLFKHRQTLTSQFNALVSNKLYALKVDYDETHQSQFYLSVCLAILGILTLIGFAMNVISMSVATYLFIIIAISSVVHGQMQIAEKHSEKVLNISNTCRYFNIGFLVLVAVSAVASSLLFHTTLMPLSFIITLTSLAAYFVHRITAFNEVFPKEAFRHAMSSHVLPKLEPEDNSNYKEIILFKHSPYPPNHVTIEIANANDW